MTDLIGDDGQRAPDFERVWKVWPKKANKKKAQIEWARMSEGVKAAVLVDAEKRDRENYWAFNPIMQLATYLRDERYTDEWQAELDKQKRSEGGTRAAKAPEAYKPIEVVQLSPEERTINLAFRNYVFCCLGSNALPETDTALTHKRFALDEVWPALKQDVDAGSTTMREALRQVADVFLDLMDKTYERGLRERVWERMSRAS